METSTPLSARPPAPLHCRLLHLRLICGIAGLGIQAFLLFLICPNIYILYVINLVAHHQSVRHVS